MPKFITKEGVTVVRDGKRIKPQIGKSFDYTDAEAADLKRLRPQAIGIEAKAEEDPRSVKSGPDSDLDDDDDDKDGKKAATGKRDQDDDKGGKKAATGKRDRAATKSDDDKL